MTDNKPKCPECGRIMAKSGWAWSGRHKVQKYKCSGCGKVILETAVRKA